MVLASNEINDGTYTISTSVTSSLTAGTGYSLAIVDASGTSVTSSSFAVVTAAPAKSITMQTPPTCVQGTSCSIGYTLAGGVSSVKLMFTGASSGTIVASTSNNPYSWTVPSNTPTGQYFVTGTDTADVNVAGVSGSFTIEATASIAIQLPATSTKWVHGSGGPVVWTKEGSTSNMVQLSIRKAGMANINYNTDNDGSYTVASSVVDSLTPGTGYTVRIVVDSITVTSQTFTVVLPDRVVVGSMPTNGCIAGAVCSIPWTAEGTVSTVTIKYVRMAGAMTSTILAASTATNP